MKLLVFIPAYNEEESIVETMEELNRQTDFDYLVIDDGSTDRTQEICLEHKYPVLHLEENGGLGNVLREAILYALEHGYDAIAQFDADGQHRCEDLIKVAEKYREEQPDIYMGVRALKGKEKIAPRMLGSFVIKMCIFFKTGTYLKDPTSGLRIFNKKTMQRYLKGDLRGPEPDMLTVLLLEGYTFREVPIIVEKRKYGESYLKGIKSLWFLIDMCWHVMLIPRFKIKRKMKEN